MVKSFAVQWLTLNNSFDAKNIVFFSFHIIPSHLPVQSILQHRMGQTYEVNVVAVDELATGKCHYIDLTTYLSAFSAAAG